MAQTITVAPENGQGLLFTQNGPGTTGGYNAIDRRRMFLGCAAKREGVFDQDGWQVTQASGGPSTTVEVKANVGLARVDGTTDAQQGAYVVAPHFEVAALDITAAHATLPRIDSVILQVLDSDFDGSGEWEARVVLLTGTPTSGDTLDRPSGAPALPDSCLHLADLRVDPLDTTISDDQIRDYRFHAGTDDVGDVKMSAATPGPGWKAMEGLALKRNAHSRLYDAIGDTLGAGDGSTTFGNLADARGRVLVHADGSAGRLTANDALGQSGGEEKHALNAAELAAHTHTGPSHTHTGITATAPDHTHPLPAAVPGTTSTVSADWSEPLVAKGGTPGSDPLAASPAHGISDVVGTQGGGAHAHSLQIDPSGTGATGSTGSGTAHNNMPPYLVAGKHYIYTGSVAA